MRGLLLATARGSGIPARPFPPSWSATKEASNPVIDVVNNPNSTLEQYTPAPIQLANGDIWCYVKGTNNLIYAWKSTDGVTFSLQNSTNPVISHGSTGAWDDGSTTEPAAVYDTASDTIHLWYGGTHGADSNYAWGHATAPGSTPTVFTKDSGNPILTSSTVATALGGGTMGDLKISDVVKIGSTYHFYGYALYASTYRLIHASGSSWNNPSGVSILLSAAGGAQVVVQTPSVFRMPELATPKYGMFYAQGGTQPSGARSIRCGTSDDGVTWDFSNTTDVVSPGSGWDATEAYAASVLKETNPPYMAPILDSLFRWRLYYSGETASNSHCNTGLAYLTPG